MQNITKEEIKDKIHEDVVKWRQDKIKELEEKKDLNETEKSFLDFLKKNDINIQLREIFFELISIIEYYMDDTNENVIFYALWLMGTYFHNSFPFYPYLFLNAMRGSGKSRLLKLLSYLGNGKYTSSITEPILFRTKGLLCIDELESIGGKDKSALRELLNASYKKGMTIMRVIKKKGVGGDNMEIEEFECYRPIAMANIWGMEEVLGDRCITRILEKSNNDIKTRIIEDYKNNVSINLVKFKLVQCSYCNVVLEKMYIEWNSFLYKYYNSINNTNIIYNTNYTKNELFYKKIVETDIKGRNLELLFPIFVIADLIGDDILTIVLEIGKKLSIEKKETEVQESRDVMVYEFISKQLVDPFSFIPIKQLYNDFKQYSEIEEEWFNIKSFGKALKRLNLVIEKRRMGRGIEIKINTIKAKEKLKIFQNTKEND